jgi:hypothetical protein
MSNYLKPGTIVGINRKDIASRILAWKQAGFRRTFSNRVSTHLAIVAVSGVDGFRYLIHITPTGIQADIFFASAVGTTAAWKHERETVFIGTLPGTDGPVVTNKINATLWKLVEDAKKHPRSYLNILTSIRPIFGFELQDQERLNCVEFVFRVFEVALGSPVSFGCRFWTPWQVQRYLSRSGNCTYDRTKGAKRNG